MQGTSEAGRVTGEAQLATERFLLRPLTAQDVSERYLGWLRDADARKYIVAAGETRTLEDLRQYVRERENRDDVLFLGIFDRSTGLHIGNIKYEPVSSELGYAIMGVLIGEPAYRGKGVTTEVLRATAAWLNAWKGITQIALGVDEANAAAIRAYEKVGFVVAG